MEDGQILSAKWCLNWPKEQHESVEVVPDGPPTCSHSRGVMCENIQTSCSINIRLQHCEQKERRKETRLCYRNDSRNAELPRCVLR